MPTDPSTVGNTAGSAAGNIGYPVNTRGIPYSVDPRNFYEYRARVQEKLADNWLEKLVYDIFGPDFIGSLALAIDPYARFKMAKLQVSPVNRTRTRTAIATKTRQSVDIERSKSWSNGVTCLNKNETLGYSYANSNTTSNLTSQGVVTSQSYDTTYHSRPIRVDFGEFEYFKPSLVDSGFKWGYVSNDAVIGSSIICGSTIYRSIAGSFFVKYPTLSSNGRYTSANFTSLKNSEVTFASQLMAKQAYGMLTQALPVGRSFSLYREIAELKDLPRTLRTTYEVLKRTTELSKIFKASWRELRVSDVPRMAQAVRREAKRTGDNYLNTQFGWGPLLRDLQALLTLPPRIGAKVNRLITRNGKDSSWRSYRKMVFPIDNPPGWTLDIPPHCSLPPATQTLGVREVELRLVVNAKVTFPVINVPYVKEDLLDEMWGADPRLVDLYDLIPWTWLIDWFSDLGDYLHLMDIVNDDRMLINGGFLTYTSTGRVTSQRVVSATGTWSRKWLGSYDTGTITSTYSVSQSATANFVYKRRKDLATIANVRSTANLGSLSTDQQSILGALFTKFL